MSGGAHGAAPSGRRGSAPGATPAPGDPGTRILAVDVGAGTADILLTRPGQPLENAVKPVSYTHLTLPTNREV